MSRPAAPPNPVMAMAFAILAGQKKAERRAAKKEPPPAPKKKPRAARTAATAPRKP